MSGLSHYPGKVAQGQPCRGFESLALRQQVIDFYVLYNKSQQVPHCAGLQP